MLNQSKLKTSVIVGDKTSLLVRASNMKNVITYHAQSVALK